MEALAVGTIVTRRDLPSARVLAASFRREHAGIPFYVLLADEVGDCFDPAEECFRLVRLEEMRIAHLDRMRFHYSSQELTYAVTPYLLSFLLDSGFQHAAFLKQESLVVGDMSAVFQTLRNAAIVLTPHLLEPLASDGGCARELNILQSGVYNVGFLGVSERPAARAFLEWWRDRTERHCLHDVRRGMHFEQRWLDLVIAFFDDVHILRDPGFNVGHWNLPERKVRLEGDRVLVNGKDCSFVRFSGFDADRTQFLTRYSDRLDLANAGPAGELFRRYAALLRAAGFEEAKSWPYAWSHFDNGVEISEAARQVYRELSDSALEAFGNPWSTEPPGSFYRWFEVHSRRTRGLRGALARAARLWRTTRADDGTAAAIRAMAGALGRRLVSVLRRS